ncbi:MAG: ROK family protein [Thermoanaerobaculia bacterium]
MKRRAKRKATPAPVVAVDLGGTKIAAALVTAAGRVGPVHEEPVETTLPEAPFEQILRIARELQRGARTAPSAIGVAVPGLVRRDGTVWAPNLPGWDAVPLARLLTRKLKMRAVVESDRNAAAIGEAWRGAARGKDDVIVLIVGTGIGAGILSGGRLVRGAHELSGCAGWMVVTDERSELAKRVGSLESSVAGPAIARAGHGREGASLAAAARQGDAEARGIFTRAGRRLGVAVANLASLFDPEAIVLTGGVASAADLFLDELKRSALEHGQPLSMPKIDIVVTELGARANLLGAARLALDAASERKAK